MSLTPLNQNEKIRRYVKVSLGLHGAFFLALIIGQWVGPGAPMMFQPTVQIDMVALPDLVKSQNNPVLDTTLPVKDAPPPPPAPPPPKETKADKAEPTPAPDKDVMVLKKEKDVQKDAKKALERLRAEAKKDQKADEKRRDELLNKREQDLKRFEEAYRSAIKGNQTNQGSSTTGEMQATLNAYAGHIREKLNGNWALPVYLQTQGLRAVVRMYVDARGNVIRYTFTKTSGNDVFDTYVKGTIQQSSPFAPPPEEMSKGLRNSGLEVQFPL